MRLFIIDCIASQKQAKWCYLCSHEVYNKDVYAIDAIEVYSVESSKITSIDWDINDNKIDLSALSDGVYYLKLLSGGVLLKTEKIVIVE